MRFPLSVVLFLLAGTAWAGCPSKAPNPAKSFFSAGDQKVNAAWLQKNLAGKKVVFPNGETEVYSPNGSYSYKASGNSWNAGSYKFYNNGMRCIGYDKPRFDLYVVNNGKLVLVNKGGERYVGRIKK